MYIVLYSSEVYYIVDWCSVVSIYKTQHSTSMFASRTFQHHGGVGVCEEQRIIKVRVEGTNKKLFAGARKKRAWQVDILVE